MSNKENKPNTMDANITAKRLKTLRENAKLTQLELARKLIEKYELKGKDGQFLDENSLLVSIKKYEAEEFQYGHGSTAGMATKTLFMFADFYGVSTDYILGKSKVKKADNDEINKRLGLTEEAIEFLTTLVKRKKMEGENIKVAYFMIKTINLLLEQEDNVSFLSTLSDFLWHEYKTENTDGCDVVTLEDLAGVQHLFSLSEMNNIKILEIQQLLTPLKDIAEAENNVKDNKKKK